MYFRLCQIDTNRVHTCSLSVSILRIWSGSNMQLEADIITIMYLILLICKIKRNMKHIAPSTPANVHI